MTLKKIQALLVLVVALYVVGELRKIINSQTAILGIR